MLFHRKKQSKLHSPWLHVQRLASTSFSVWFPFHREFLAIGMPNYKSSHVAEKLFNPSMKIDPPKKQPQGFQRRKVRRYDWTLKKHIQKKTKPRQIFGTLGSEHQKVERCRGRIWITKSNPPRPTFRAKRCWQLPQKGPCLQPPTLASLLGSFLE